MKKVAYCFTCEHFLAVPFKHEEYNPTHEIEYYYRAKDVEKEIQKLREPYDSTYECSVCEAKCEDGTIFLSDQCYINGGFKKDENGEWKPNTPRLSALFGDDDQ